MHINNEVANWYFGKKKNHLTNGCYNERNKYRKK